MPEKLEKLTGKELAAVCEKIAYDHKAEDILRLDMSGIEGAQSDYYLICTAVSEPHTGAIAERIRREVREIANVRPITVDGTPKSQWIIVDFGSVMIHVLSKDAREKYQLEALWGDAPKTDVIAKLDAEYRKRKQQEPDQQ